MFGRTLQTPFGPDVNGAKARQLDIQQKENVAFNPEPVRPASDEHRTTSLVRTSRTRAGTLLRGCITYALPHYHWYRVQLEQLGGDLPCCRLWAAGAAPLAVKDDGLLAIGTGVLVFWKEGDPFGVILGAIPPLTEAAAPYLADWLAQAGGTGFWHEGYYNEIFSLTDTGRSVFDFSGGRSIDGTSVGEVAWLSPLGNGLFIDPFMLFCRMNEACGLWMFYFDSLLRIHGYNMDIRTAISEQVIRNDQGEGYGYRGYTAYPWEAHGLWAPAFPYQTTNPSDVAGKGVRAAYEVSGEKGDLLPFYRTEYYEGYCGQAGFRQVLLPPHGVTQGENRYLDPEKKAYPAVFREQVGFDGSYMLSSAHSIGLVKRLTLPAPRRTKLIEDATGDDQTEKTPGEYRFAGHWGEGERHVIGNILFSGEYPLLTHTSAVLDITAYSVNWKGLHPFVYHQKDFWIPTGDDLKPTAKTATPLDFSTLKKEQFLELPKPVKLKVDERYGEQDYYETTAGVWILPDGSIVLRDAYGAELRMTGGNIYLSAPGDVYLQPGKSLVTYAGKDCVLKAHNSVDITAAKHDVRLKAEVNLDMLAGNGGKQGRLLIENQAGSIKHTYKGKFGEDVEGSGVLIKARNSQFVAMAQDIYLRTGNKDGKIAEGKIVLDAAKGKQDIITFSRKLTNYAEEKVEDTVGTQQGGYGVYQRDFNEMLVPGRLSVRGGAVFTGGDGLVTNGSIQVRGGHIATDRAKGYDGKVGELDAASRNIATGIIANVQQRVVEAATRKQNEFQIDIEKEYHEKDKIGNAEMQEAISFAPRTAKQMGTERWTLPETAWQQTARLSRQTLNVWTENTIEYQGQPMLPHPGHQTWAIDQNFLQTDLQYHDAASGQDKATGLNSEYAQEPKEIQFNRAVAARAYFVIGE